MDRMLRPNVTVLSESAIVPASNLIQPPPNKFTHEVIGEQPYFYKESKPGGRPDGSFPAGTRVALLYHEGGDTCRVADGRGLYVETAYDGLQPIGHKRAEK